jgi:hypothetical protein
MKRKNLQSVSASVSGNRLPDGVGGLGGGIGADHFPFGGFSVCSMLIRRPLGGFLGYPNSPFFLGFHQAFAEGSEISTKFQIVQVGHTARALVGMILRLIACATNSIHRSIIIPIDDSSPCLGKFSDWPYIHLRDPF